MARGHRATHGMGIQTQAPRSPHTPYGHGTSTMGPWRMQRPDTSCTRYVPLDITVQVWLEVVQVKESHAGQVHSCQAALTRCCVSNSLHRPWLVTPGPLPSRGDGKQGTRDTLQFASSVGTNLHQRVRASCFSMPSKDPTRSRTRLGSSLPYVLGRQYMRSVPQPCTRAYATCPRAGARPPNHAPQAHLLYLNPNRSNSWQHPLCFYLSRKRPRISTFPLFQTS